MALYPSPPSWRMPYDKDGTIVLRADWSAPHIIEELTQQLVERLNNEDNTTTGLSDARGRAYVWMFPNERDIDGVFWSFADPRNATMTWEVSTDTTNGLDGTWTEVYRNTSVTASGVTPRFRTGVLWNSWLGVRALRLGASGGPFGSSSEIQAIHIYGEGIGNRQELCFWHASLDQRLAPQYLDFGDVPRSTSADRVFRVKNLDAGKTAKNVRVAFSALTDSTPALASQHLLSIDGLTFMSQVNVGDLPPGAMSVPITMRKVTPSNAPLGTWAPRVFAEPSEWI